MNYNNMATKKETTTTKKPRAPRKKKDAVSAITDIIGTPKFESKTKVESRPIMGFVTITKDINLGDFFRSINLFKVNTIDYTNPSDMDVFKLRINRWVCTKLNYIFPKRLRFDAEIYFEPIDYFNFTCERPKGSFMIDKLFDIPATKSEYAKFKKEEESIIEKFKKTDIYKGIMFPKPKRKPRKTKTNGGKGKSKKV